MTEIQTLLGEPCREYIDACLDLNSWRKASSHGKIAKVIIAHLTGGESRPFTIFIRDIRDRSRDLTDNLDSRIGLDLAVRYSDAEKLKLTNEFIDELIKLLPELVSFYETQKENKK